MKPWLKNSSDNPMFDEFYTTKEQCEIIFDEIIPIINEQTNKNKISVCCPCDGEQSEIPKYLAEHTNWSIDYFGDLDMNSEEARERMLKADVIITNPPFRMREWRPFITWLITNKKNFFIWGPLLQTNSPKLRKFVIDNAYIYINKEHKGNIWMYNRPDGSQKRAITEFYTSYKIPVYKYNYKPIDEVQYYNGIPVYDRRCNIPPDYTGWMYVPITTLHYLQPFDIDITKKCVPGKYVRLCVRRKAI